MPDFDASTWLDIPHPDLDGQSIIGILERRAAVAVRGNSNGRAKPIALILHGTMGHKDYLYQKRLARRLPIDSFRFDFRGSNETPGLWRMSGFADDVADISVVVSHLTRELDYTIALIVGHSRGSVSGLTWMCTAPEGQTVRGYVNCSGRYRMERIYDSLPRYQAEFDERGYYEWKVSVAWKPVVGIIAPEHLEEFARWDTSIIKTSFPSNTHVLTIHGMADRTVPTYDAVMYAQVLGTRLPGTHSLHLIEEADHNFTGRSEEVNDAILSWWDALEQGDLKTGVWCPSESSTSSKL